MSLPSVERRCPPEATGSGLVPAAPRVPQRRAAYLSMWMRTQVRLPQAGQRIHEWWYFTSGTWKLTGNSNAANSIRDTLVSSRHDEHSMVQVPERRSVFV
jgi:hypothetical protein